MPAYKDKNGTWFAKFQYRDNGKPKPKLKRGFRTKRDALDYERKFLENYAPTVDMTFDALAKRFMDAKERELRANTLRGYRVVVESPYVEPIRNKKLSEITMPDILDVRSAMSELNGSSVNLYMTKLSQIFGFAVAVYGLKANPCAGIRAVAANKREIRFLTIDDADKIKALPGIKEDAVMLLDILMWTGIRISEALALTVGDITEQYISVTKHKIRTADGQQVQQGLKNNSGRRVPIFNSLYMEIKEYIGKMYSPTASTVLFPLHYVSYQERFKRHFEQAGLHGATLHSFRHSHVALLIHLGYSPKMIADRIGDKVETMLSVYAHIYTEDVTEMMDELQNVSHLYHDGA